MIDELWLHRTLQHIQRDIGELQRQGPPRVYEELVTTTNATPTLIHAFSTASGVCYIFEITVVARRTDVAGNNAQYRRTLGAKNVGGVVTLSAVGADYTAEDDATWDVTFAVSGTDINMSVTGAVGKTINWKMHARLDQI